MEELSVQALVSADVADGAFENAASLGGTDLAAGVEQLVDGVRVRCLGQTLCAFGGSDSELGRTQLHIAGGEVIQLGDPKNGFRNRRDLLHASTLVESTKKSFR